MGSHRRVGFPGVRVRSVGGEDLRACAAGYTAGWGEGPTHVGAALRSRARGRYPRGMFWRGLAAIVGGAALACAGNSMAPRELKVSAAMSLKEAFAAIEVEFEAGHPGVDVVFNFAGSQILAGQIEEGAPVDVFASADEAQMQRAIASGRITAAERFASNRLVIISPAATPIAGAHELTRAGLRLVLAGPGVPAGSYARQALQELGVAQAALTNLVSNEENVRGVVGKVSAGEADAGVVYATDVTPAVADKLHVAALAVSVTPRYEVAVLKDSLQTTLAQEFVSAVRGSAGQATLAKHGFLPP
jgi:molybdate transport system substrate-binding protein